MNRALVDRIANAVLYEGYILYPYRPSVKNRHRWTFGGLYPERYCQAEKGSAASGNQTECLLVGGPDAILEVSVRFLHLTARLVGECVPPLAAWPGDLEPPYRLVETLRVGDRLLQTWQEAEERTIDLAEVPLGILQGSPLHRPFHFPRRRWLESVAQPGGTIAAVLVREQQAIEGAIELSAAPLTVPASPEGEVLVRLTLRITNTTPLDGTGRDEALLRTLASTHALLGVRGGTFVSLLDPPQEWREHAAACRNLGVWPVLVGEEGPCDTVLASPIILPDHPQVAPESPGDLFDCTEIDEILHLRILTLTDEEKAQVAAVDDRARALLTRSEGLTPEQMLGLHGTLRGLRPIHEERAG